MKKKNLSFNKFSSTKNYGYKKVWVQKKFRSEFFFGSNKILASTEILGPKKFRYKNFWLEPSDLTIPNLTWPVITWLVLSQLDFTWLNLTRCKFICPVLTWPDLTYPILNNPNLTFPVLKSPVLTWLQLSLKRGSTQKWKFP